MLGSIEQILGLRLHRGRAKCARASGTYGNYRFGSPLVTRANERVVRAIGSSEQVHVVDALAITGDEGRGSLRNASGSWQTSFDPEMSEWGNPLLRQYQHLNP